MAYAWLSPGSGNDIAHVTQVEPRTEECFYEDLTAGMTFEIDFEVIRGGLLDIEFKIKSPDDHVQLQRLAFFNHKYVIGALSGILNVLFVCRRNVDAHLPVCHVRSWPQGR